MLASEEFLSISRRLECHHAIFNQLWSMSRPVMTEDVPTLAVLFDKVGECIDFKINPNFWSTLTDLQKDFVIAHECLHVILYHGFRISNLEPHQRGLANMALDVVVNHSLVSQFG